jgi:uncharacterized protein (UPF0335 family)
MTIDREQFKALATQFRDLQDSNKNSVDRFMEQVAGHGIDTAGLRRYVARKRQGSEKRAQQDAIDQQCLYLAGERDTPAELPIGCELAQAINLFRRNMTVQQVAAELRVSNGKAGKLRQLGQMFDVSIHSKMDGRRKPKVTVITPPEVASLPTGHDAKGNPLEADSDGVVQQYNAGPEQGAVDSSRRPDDASQAHGYEPPAMPTAAVGAEVGAILREQVATSTDPARLEREARHAEGVGQTDTPLDLAQNEVQPDVRENRTTEGDQRATEPAGSNTNKTDVLGHFEGDQPAGSAPAINPDEDDLAIPVFLRRQQEAAA